MPEHRLPFAMRALSQLTMLAIGGRIFSANRYVLEVDLLAHKL